ncbi:MAG: HRDC domain-containing protein, partial [Acidimicrobiales bacterium]
LLYVAMTRAESELHCSWAARRSFGSRSVRREPSPHLEIIEIARTVLAEGHEPAAVGAWVAEGRRRLADAQAEVTPGTAGSGSRRHRNVRQGAPFATTEALGNDADSAVLAALREWRASTARASGVPAYVIFHDSTLAALAAAKPTTPAGLMDLPGLGPVKTARYGTKLLELIAGAAG